MLPLSAYKDFADTFDIGRYARAPSDWFIAVSDVINSTEAIARGRYKDVNMAGAATIASILNACGRDDLPFTFGGDGGLVLVPPELKELCAQALRATKRMCADVLGLNLRCSLIPVAELHKRGRDILIAAHDLGSGRILSMLSGGGIELADQLCKSPDGAAFALDGDGGEPDLTGLSCRWAPLPAGNGMILAIVVRAKDSQSALPDIYREIFDRIASLAGGNSSPLKPSKFSLRWPPQNIGREAAFGGRKGRFTRKVKILLEVMIELLSQASGKRIGDFDARTYQEALPRHSDYRKFADGLRMIVDCSEEQAKAIGAYLDAEWCKGKIDYGTHSAGAALMTCFVRSTEDAGHIHFIDAADGGYAQAALDMKKRSRVENVAAA